MSVWKELETGVTTRSPEETRALGERIAQEMAPDAVIALEGDLGVGKTTLVQGIARGLGIVRHVTSPTFTLYSVYHGERTLVHLDAYRLDGATSAEELLIEDFLQPPYCLVIEWPSRISSWLPSHTRTLELSILEPGVHRIRTRDSLGVAPLGDVSRTA
ncbi:MAG TPA: tRNA (adenosine(37)-N6)-threonylcarbamoyltransferase complex ATPase subunit type 1 TsaE [Opitutaceae bacterium]|nr:tRNA (adenosine(37)-N6)-threonylcarbamoyltransferase complex ATPase subunit type 1 TsaE [Opitutaceae bacterium]